MSRRISFGGNRPFRTGNLIVFSGDKVGKVEHLGLRSTPIYSLGDHATGISRLSLTKFANTLAINLQRPEGFCKILRVFFRGFCSFRGFRVPVFSR